MVEPDDLAHRCAIEHLEFINEEGGSGKLQDYQKEEIKIFILYKNCANKMFNCINEIPSR